ncbi:CDP-alcohol phosphatidyltransferase family protein [Planctomyces sp. SH-PL62]|uniref:CDP-alcohol phosphatidyltransferase family protein n=1 Tax=Planctomyces sp. SH-PL62 TaxID=1636152 RepID=UPI00078BFBE9|nr:CDP-alcohol phosphatidyltransferase family protein [Planctomyces sp. SH-PL62]AMV39846.1 CDP-alcohol phosphatidyltransferase [Planctomyces sp. SH-PL62]
MAAPALNLVIDARPSGPRGLLAAEVFMGRSVLSHLVEQALDLVGPGRAIAVLAGRGQIADLAPLLRDAEADRVTLVDAAPTVGAAVLRTDRLYDGRRLKRAVSRGRDPESAAFWRLDRPEALAGAEQELNRRLNYQPLGRYWAFPIADRLAAALRPTRVGPNALTLAAGGLMLAGAALVACGGSGWTVRAITALAFAAALVLDTADGRLARLQGSCSAFGRWLDQVLDELADVALHAAIAWAAFAATMEPIWLVLGMLFASGKYMFLIQSLTGEAMEKSSPRGAEAPRPARCGRLAWIVGPVRSLVGGMGHADLRWHVWIVLAAVGRLDAALVAYAAYFPLRALAGIARKGAAHA